MTTSLWHSIHPDAVTHETDRRRAQLVVVGAGVTGLTTALEAARRGLDVVVIDAGQPGSGTTGSSTAKVSLLQGARLSTVARHGSDRLEAYVRANRAGQDWLVRFANECGVDLQHRPAYSYATTDIGSARVEREHAVARAAGLDASLTRETELPFPVQTALRLDDQVQVDPLDLVEALTRAVIAAGGHVQTGARLDRLSARRDGVLLETTRGDVVGDNVIIATATPILDRGFHFARLTPKRSYTASFRLSGPAPLGMYLSVDEPSRSVRSLPTSEGGEMLLVGGNGHTTGRVASEAGLLDDLNEWTLEHWPGATMTAEWSAQDYHPVGDVPMVGILPWTGGRVQVATGFDKWGFTNGSHAALTMVGRVVGRPTEWDAPLHSPHIDAAVIASTIGANAAVAREYVRGYARALRPRREGEVRVAREGARLVAASPTPDGTCRVSGLCTHLGAVLEWNDAERSWDCPAHGSRFTPGGDVIEGPAKKGLRRLA